MNRHSVAKPVIHLRLPPQEDSFRCQQEVSRLFWDKAVPALDELFDRLAPASELVRIERLEVKLKFSRWEDFVGAFVEAVTEAVEEEIARLSRTPPPGMELLPVREAWFSEWLIFLETGAFRWQISLPPEAEWNRAVLDTLAISAAAVERLSKLLRKNPVAFERLIRQHSPAFLKTLVELRTGTRQEKLPALARELAIFEMQLRSVSGEFAPANMASGFARQPKLFFWQKVLELAIVQREKRSWQEIAEAVLPLCFEPALPPARWETVLQAVAEVPEKTFPALSQAAKTWSKKEKTSKKRPATGEEKRAGDAAISAEPTATVPGEASKKMAEAPAKKDVAKKDLAKQPRPEVAIPTPIETSRQPSQQLSEPDAPAQQPAPAEAKPAAEAPLESPGALAQAAETTPQQAAIVLQKNVPAAGEATEHFIRNAGVALLHPFLLPFFRATGLLEGQAFKDEAARSTAVHLLQYLATKETGLPEYELLLPKLLCGMPFVLPLEREIALEKSALDEAEHLLGAVIQHWGALGNTSTDGLREGFLQRDGKLEFKNSGWHLNVEHKTLDILLARLPWGLSMVKLPWMPDILRVDWT